MRRAGRVTLALVVVAGGVLGAGGHAAAHAGLEGSSPSASAVLEVPPTEIVLDFDDPVEQSLADVRLLFQDGSAIALGDPLDTGDPTQVVSPVLAPEEMALGVYVVVFRVASADSNPVDGAFSFQLGTGQVGAGAADQASVLASLAGSAATSNTTVARAMWVARFAAIAGVLVLTGGWLLLAVAAGGGVPDRRTVLVLRWSLGVAALGTLGVFALQGPRVRGAGLGGVFDHLPDVSGTRFGQSLLVRLVLLVLAVAPTWSAGQAHTARWRFAAGFVGVALLATFGAGGHPAAQPLPVLGVALDTAHLGAAAAWIGGLVVLAVAHRTWLDGEPMGTTPAAALRRFSLVAMVAVLVVVATGAAQALRLLEAFDLLGTTDWGRTLLVKVSAVTLLVTVGATTGYALRRHGPASLRAAVVAEAAIGLAVVGLSAGLVTGSPHGASTGLTPSVVRAVEGDVAVTLTVTPAQVGVNELHLLVALPVTATEPSQSASVRFSLPERGIDGLAVALAPEGPDHYSAYGVQLPYAGTWTVAVTVGFAGGDEVVVQTVVVIADG